MDNLLEHVLDPLSLLKQTANLLSPKGILMIEVPNDFSLLHKTLMDDEFVKTPFWVAYPDHISYFNNQGLANLCLAAGFKKEMSITDFPVDFCLLNPDSNYCQDKSKGENAHLLRIKLENLFCQVSIPATVEFHRALANLGFGRNIISFYTLSKVNQI